MEHRWSSEPGGRLAVGSTGWVPVGAFLTLVSALQGWAHGFRAGSTGMFKPLASSRAASSVSCEQGGRELLPALGPGSPPSISLFCGLSFSALHPLVPAHASYSLSISRLQEEGPWLEEVEEQRQGRRANSWCSTVPPGRSRATVWVTRLPAA